MLTDAVGPAAKKAQNRLAGGSWSRAFFGADGTGRPQLKVYLEATLLVLFVRRPGGQSQFSAQMRARPATTPSIAELQRWLSDHLDADLTVDALAGRAGMSPRNFARAFRRETGTTPAMFVGQLRVEAARRLLEDTDLTIAAVASRVGSRHAETLHRVFRRQVGTTPERYRQHFGRRAS